MITAWRPRTAQLAQAIEAGRPERVGIVSSIVGLGVEVDCQRIDSKAVAGQGWWGVEDRGAGRMCVCERHKGGGQVERDWRRDSCGGN